MHLTINKAYMYVCVCVCACVRACVRACVLPVDTDSRSAVSLSILVCV